MSYAIELSINILKDHKNNMDLNDYEVLADRFKCDTQYFTYDLENISLRKIQTYSIQVIIFEKENFDNFINFIYELRKLKRNYIECIYQDEVACNILYASPQYIRKMGKHQGKEFKKQRKLWKPTTDIEKKVFEAMKKR